jgi:Mg2+/Co2+ transporter CorB
MWVRDDVPEELYEEMKKTASLHTMDDMREDIKKVFVDTLFVERKAELEKALNSFVENKEKTVEE